MALRQLTPEEKARMSGTNGTAPSSLGTGAGAMKANPRSTPASQAAASVPKTYETPPIVQPGQSQSQLRSLTNNEAVNIQKARDANYSQNYTNPALMSNPRDLQTQSGGGVQQGTTVGGGGATPPLEFGNNLPAGAPATAAPAQAATTPQVPGQTTAAQLPTGGAQPTGGTTTPGGAQNASTGQTAPVSGTPAQTQVDANGKPIPQDQNGQMALQNQPNPEGGNADMIDAATKSQKEGANNYLTQAQQMAQQTLDVSENARRMQIIGTLNGTNAQAIAQSMGLNLTDMTTQQLEGLLVNSGLEPSKAITDRISQEGAAAIDSVKMEAGDLLATNKYTADQISRTLGRQVDDRERFNIQQDAKLKKMASIYGGGSSSSSGNTAILQAEEQGQRALEDLNAEYAGRMDQIGRQANAITRQAADQTRQINNQVQDAIQSKYAEVQAKAQELIAAGVTNQKDYNTAMTPILKEYTGLYNDATKWGAEQHIANQKTVFDQAAKLREEQFNQDKENTLNFGVVFKNGQPMVDAQGQPVPTMSALKQQHEMDAKDSELAGVYMRNGQKVLGPDGQPIPIASMAQFQVTENRLERNMQLEDERGRMNIAISAKNAQTADDRLKSEQTGLVYSGGQVITDPSTGQPMTTFAFDKYNDESYQKKLDRDIEMAKNGLQMASGTELNKPTSSFNASNSKYDPTAAPNGIQLNPVVQEAAGGKAVLSSSRRQCGEYVNDAIGIPNYFGDTIAQKKTKVTSQTPVPGSAFVLNIPGVPAGHVGMVEQVNPDGTLVISESNYDGHEHYRKITTTMDALKQRGLVGFTGGLTQKSGVEASAAGPIGGAGKTTAQQQQTATYVQRMAEAEKIFQNVAPSVESAATGARNIPLLGGLISGVTTGRALPGFMQGSEIQQQEQAEKNFINANLRRESGAAISPAEFEQARSQYFPQPGDTPEVIENKRQNRQTVMEGLQREAQNGAIPSDTLSQ